MNTTSRTAQLCVAGTQAEFERRIEDARELYRQAWDAALDDYDAAIAAHYIGHLASDPHDALRWHLVALQRAQLDSRADEFMGSLFVSVGAAHEALGESLQAERYFELAAERGVQHQRR